MRGSRSGARAVNTALSATDHYRQRENTGEQVWHTAGRRLPADGGSGEKNYGSACRFCGKDA